MSSLVLHQQYTRSEATRSLEVKLNLIARWIKEHEQNNDGQAFRGNDKLMPEQEEIRQLKLNFVSLKWIKTFKASDGLPRQTNQIR